MLASLFPGLDTMATSSSPELLGGKPPIDDQDLSNSHCQNTGHNQCQEQVEADEHVHDHDPEFDEFAKTIQLSELCMAASGLRDGLPCSMTGHIVGGNS
jgi:hypothetical protein